MHLFPTDTDTRSGVPLPDDWRISRGAWRGLALAVAWSLVVGAAVLYTLAEESAKLREIAHGEARGIFELMVDTRSWIARNGRMYREVTPQAPPNPYLVDPNRDVTTSGGFRLTMVNPSFATRQIGEIAAERNHARVRITSSKPIRPGNAPLPWEVPVLRKLEAGEGEWSEFVAGGDGAPPLYRYMAPLKTEQACLDCHAAQGYRVGDVRGALSIAIPVGRLFDAQRSAHRRLIPAALFLWLLGVTLIMVDAGNRRRHLKLTGRLAELSLTDELTGLYNRRGFMTLGEQQLRLADRLAQRFVLLYIDLDGMKLVNDRFGHQEGDRLLKLFAEVLRAVFRSADIVGRLGGDEFGVIALEPPGDDFEAVLKRLNDEADRVNAAAPQRPWRVSFSVGLAACDPGRAESLDALLRRADESMYLQKSAKKSPLPGR
jgi:diguanylate cyclase (GGDEF)-like protein